MTAHLIPFYHLILPAYLIVGSTEAPCLILVIEYFYLEREILVHVFGEERDIRQLDAEGAVGRSRTGDERV